MSKEQQMRRKNKTSLFNMRLKALLKKLPILVALVAIFYTGLLIKDIEMPTVVPVKEIAIEGDLKYLDKKKIISALTQEFEDGYISVDLKQMREVLLQQPWIKEVSLRRKWPASVSVFIEEHKPLAFWNSDSYISESGDVFKPLVIDKNLNLPQLSGPDTQHNNVLKFMNVLYSQLAQINYEVKRLDLDERRSWQLIIVERNLEKTVDGKTMQDQQVNERQVINVKLGRFDTEKRLQRFVGVLPALTAEIKMTKNKIKMIDMRYPNGFAVQMVDQMTDQSNSAANSIKRKKVTEVTRDFMGQGYVVAHRYAIKSMGGV